MKVLLSKVLTRSLPLVCEYDQKLLINTINAHSFNVAHKDPEFYNALLKSDILLPDGIGIVFAVKLINRVKLRKIAGYDLFMFEMERLNQSNGKCFFLGSSNNVLLLMQQRACIEYPNVKIDYYSPPFKTSFNIEDNKSMIETVNSFAPDVLFIGMTAPKQEKWAARYFKELEAKHICSIGAVFDFYAGTIKRAPACIINIGLEWLYRLLSEPKRMWKRYLIGNTKFIGLVFREKLKKNE